MRHWPGAIMMLAMAVPGIAQVASPDDRARAIVAAAGPGLRFGLVVTDETGREIVALAPDDRFVPASNTKMFTTAAAFAMLDVAPPDAAGGASVRLDGEDVILEGHGDARLSSLADCRVDCLGVLADAVAAKTRRVHDVIGDDTLFPDERWSQGMAWNNIPTPSGTAVSALTIDDNEDGVTVSPGVWPGSGPVVAGSGYHAIDNRVTTGARTALAYGRLPMARTIRVTGTIAAGGMPQTLRLGIDDPADYAAWRLRAMLRARGVQVIGEVGVRHRAPSPSDDPATRGGAPVAHPPRATPLAVLVPPPLADDLVHTNKVSQNLHAALLLNRVGLVTGGGSTADGLAAVRAMLARAGVTDRQASLSDGSGMSTYNRVSPRGAVTFLRWTQAQPWGAAWRATLPVGGVDGTLRRRFVGTALAGKVFAKTGSLNATNALAGFLTAASGRTLVFAAYANDVPAGVSGTAVIDRVLAEVAAGN